jgi:hypothetical protein
MPTFPLARLGGFRSELHACFTRHPAAPARVRHLPRARVRVRSRSPVRSFVSLASESLAWVGAWS